jgi:quercetin dioxygenase-like cupin family protein
VTEDGGMKKMTAGDSITIPRNFVHQARNLGKEEAILAIAFSSAARETRAEDPKACG